MFQNSNFSIFIAVFTLLAATKLVSQELEQKVVSSKHSFYWIVDGNPEPIPQSAACRVKNATTSQLPPRLKTHQKSLRFWETGPPFYQWQKLMTDLSKTYPHRRNGGRMAHFYGGIHDAIQLAYSQLPDSLIYPIRQLPKSQHLHYQLALIATAETARETLSFYFPEGQGEIDALYQKQTDFIHLLKMDPCWIKQGRAIGQQIAKYTIQKAQKDRTRSDKNISFRNQNEGHWYGTPSPKDYAKRQWRPFVLDHPSQFRCVAPPASWEKDMQELRQFNQNHAHSDIAWKWKSSPVWDQWLDQLMFEYQLDLEPLKAAFIYATFHIARYEATLSAWEAKYHYMGIRPFQYDTTFQPLLVHTPNFPGYPAGHTTVAGALAEIIAHFFPPEAQHAKRLALECSESRFEGGVHFRTDNEVGLQQGKRVGQAIIGYIEE